MKINFSNNKIIAKDIKHVGKILKSGWLTHGKNTINFENEFKKFTGAKFAITISSCTAGLHLSCMALNLNKDDEVIVPSQTHVATAHAVKLTGAKPIFCDVDYLTGLINLEEIKKKISQKTKAIIIVHMNGFSCNISEIKKICLEKKIKIIEDCAHGLGTSFNKKHVGNFGISGVFSFYPTKQITTGEGGMLITNNKKFADKIKSLKAFGIDKDITQRKIPGYYDVKDLGINYRMTDFQAALGYNQLKRYPRELRLRKKNAKYLFSLLKNINGIKLPDFKNNYSYFIFPIHTNTRKKIMEKLKEKKIGFSIHYAKALHEMTYYKNKNLRLVNAEKYAKTNLSLPIYGELSKKDLDYIYKAIK
jgi:perosamine synthetase